MKTQKNDKKSKSRNNWNFYGEGGWKSTSRCLVVITIIAILIAFTSCTGDQSDQTSQSTSSGQTDQSSQTAKAASGIDLIESAAQLNDSKYTVSVAPGSAGAVLADELFPNANIIYINSLSDACLDIQQGKSDAFFYCKAYMKYALASGVLDDLAIMDETLAETDLAVGISPKRADLLPEINAFIAELKQDGTLDDMYNRWIIEADTGMPDIEKPKNPDRVLKVGTSGIVVPFNYYDENQQLSGYDLELTYRLAAYLNAEVKVEAMSFDALVAGLESGKLDIVISDLNVTEERKEVILMSDTYMADELCLLVQKERIAASDSEVYGAAETAQSADSGSFLEKMKASFERTFIKESRWKILRDGLLVTLEIAAAAMVIGSLLGFGFSFLLRSRHKGLRALANAVSTFLNGIPIVVILMVLYYIVFKSSDISAVWVAIIGFSLDFANVVAGLLNTGVLAVDRGELEAAASMGYSKFQIFNKITFPQAARQMFSQYEAAVVALVKGTAIVGYITVEDLTKAVDIIRGRTYEAFFPLIVTAILYFLLACAFVLLLKRVDVRLDPKRRPRSVKGVREKW